MRSSDSLEALSASLTLVQGALRALEPTHTNAHLRSKYADLAAVWAHIRSHLASGGLSVVQGVSSEGGNASVTTRLLHSTGQWIEDTCMVPVSPQKGLNAAQCMGLALTYARRYGLAAIVGVTVSDEDPDGGGPTNARPSLDEDLRTEELVAAARKHGADRDGFRIWWGDNQAEIDALSEASQEAIRAAAREARSKA